MNLLNKNKKILIGLTGNIASGKSLALTFFDKELFEKVDSDKLAKKHLLALTIKNMPHYLKKKDIFRFDGKIDKEKLSSIAFSDKLVMKNLEEIIHPLVIKDIKKILKYSNKKFLIVESAIIFESKLKEVLDKIITVFAPFEIRIERLINRAHISYLEAKKRIEFQADDYQKILNSDFVIDNSKDKKWMIRQIKNIEKRLLQLNKAIS
ncbi:MAG: dephospho-CoA kinase [Deltaproteobacteria bacterium]|nr:dephospho-CoA kinase [Deltaproteobacteria bacterium]